MFFKVIALMLVAMVGHFVVEYGFDDQQTVLFSLMPVSTILGYLLLGISE